MKTFTIVKRKAQINLKVIYTALLSFAIFGLLVAMVAQPQVYMHQTLNALIVWATILLPSLFPFILYTKFLSSLGMIEPISKSFSNITSKLYNVSGISSFVYLMSIMSGYPVGAKLTTDLYMEGKINRGEAQRMITFCANCGPMFLIGTVGVGFLANKTGGYIMLISHFWGALLNGLIYRKYKLNDKTTLLQKNTSLCNEDVLSKNIISSANSMFVVGAYIVIFFVLIQFLNTILPINQSSTFGALFNGFFEITHGCKDIANLTIASNWKIILCCFIASFGGLATAMQSITFLKKLNINFSFFLLFKFTHALLSTVICALCCLIF